MLTVNCTEWCGLTEPCFCLTPLLAFMTANWMRRASDNGQNRCGPRVSFPVPIDARRTNTGRKPNGNPLRLGTSLALGNSRRPYGSQIERRNQFADLFAVIVQTARCRASSSTRLQYGQRTWILFSGKCEKKSAGFQLQAVLDWGTGILVLSVAAYSCASDADTEKFPKGVPAPNWSSSPRQRCRWENSQSFRRPSRLFLVPWFPRHPFPAIRRQSLLSTLVHYRMTRNCSPSPLERFHDSTRPQPKLFL